MMSKKSHKPRTKQEKKLHRRIIWGNILTVIVVLGLTACVAGGVMIFTMVKSTAVTLDVSDFQSKENTIIYDRSGDIIANIGAENRVNVTYDRLPQVLVDAFVAVEDSRFFEHNGFDLPRFVRSALVNLQTGSFAQGGSTLTMQMVKNTYFVTDEHLAPNTIDRKVQEIYLATKIEKLISKKKIFELYINKINFGGTSRGVQSACSYYFNKDVSEINLSEAAVLAGVINGPNLYNPYYNVDWCTERRNVVLGQMLNHGYITEEEYNAAVKVPIENLLAGEDRGYADAETDSLQSYVDAVLNEVETLTGEDPYTTGMKIYTAMDRHTQDVADQICQDKLVGFPDDYFQIGIAVVNVHTGEIVALGGGRGRSGQRTFSFATDARKSPGSSIKPIMDYGPAFNWAGVSSADYVLDAPIKWEYTNITVSNASRTYAGMISIEDAMIRSLNIPAILELRKTRAAVSDSVLIDYLKEIGFDEDVAENFNEQYAISGSTMVASPLQMAAAMAMLMNNGVYITPHCITRIEFLNSEEEPLVPDYTGVQALTPQAAWLVTQMLRKDVTNDYYLHSFGPVTRSYPTYAKTGTSDWGDEGLQYGIPYGATKDHWLNCCTEQFSISCWSGYDTASADHPSYIASYSSLHIPAYIDSYVLDALEESYGTPGEVSNPGGLSSETFVKGTWPYLSAPSWLSEDSDYIVSGQSLNAKVSAWPTPTADTLTGFDISAEGDAVTEIDLTTLNRTTTITLNAAMSGLQTHKSSHEELNNGIPVNYYRDEIDGTQKYYIDVYLNGQLVDEHVTTNASETYTITLENLEPGDYTLNIDCTIKYTIAPVSSDTLSRDVSFHVNAYDIPVNPGEGTGEDTTGGDTGGDTGDGTTTTNP